MTATDRSQDLSFAVAVRYTLWHSDDGASIPSLAQGEHIQDLFGFGRLVPVNPVSGPVEILVKVEDEGRAIFKF